MKKLIFAISALALAAASLSARDMTAPGIEKYVSYDARPASVAEPQYTADGTAILRLDDASRIVKVDIKTGKEIETLFDIAATRETTLQAIDGFTVSPDGSKILVWNGERRIYRHSYTAQYYVYEIRSRLLKPLSEAHSPQRAPLFSPDGRMVAFVADDNNIYLRKLDYNTEVAVTTDGSVGNVINGVPDWTYEEEFSTDCSMTWSPDNLMLCFIKYNESRVPLYDFPLYGGACDADKQYALYPGSFSYKYPVAGQPNSAVSVHSYDVETRKTKQVPLSGDIEYIPRISYAYSPDRLAVVTLNRAQNRMEILAVNPRTLVAKSMLVEESQAWLDPAAYEDISWQADGFVIFSSRSGYSHLYKYSYTGQMMRQLTSGKFDVTAYYGCDERSGRCFYQSTETGAINRVVCSIDLKGAVKRLSPDEGTASMWLTPAGEYYTLRYSSVTQPPVYTLYATAGDKKARVIEDNAEYARRYADEPCREFFTFNTEQGVTLNGFMVKPHDFSPARRYPVVMYQYSGPGSQEVLNRWSIDWMTYYARQGFIVACVDPRGTGGRGREFMDVVYKDLGHYETIDQMAAARYIASLPYVDADRIGMFGWSYGGYETLMCMTTGADCPWACGVAVAPVTDWRLYDTVYAERYMLTPKENEQGYAVSAPLNRVGQLDRPVLIIHGTADDNVHLANTIEFVSALEVAGGYCDMLLFPNMNHSIYGCNSREVLYSKMLDYFKRNM